MTLDDEDEAPAVFETDLRSLPLIARGKVRDNYAVGEDRILIVASDRISAFDVVMNEAIAGKGRLLTEMALFWFERLQHIVPNHLTGDDPESVVAEDEREQVRGRSMLVKRLEPLPIEAVVRGYLAGSGWTEYQASGSVCGVALPPGLQLASKLPAPIFTPATKAAAGHHDENIDFERMSELIGDQRACQVRDIALRLYAEAAAYSESRGIIIADTKFEFGIDASGALVLMDEVLTPDSSRYWPAEEWEPGKTPASYDKQVLRDWLESVRVDGASWPKSPPPPKLDPEIVERTRRIYEQARDAMLAADDEEMQQSAQISALQRSIGEEQDPLVADHMRVDLVVALARCGRQKEADHAAVELRKRRRLSPHPTLTIRMNWAEGVADYRGGRRALAFDKMKRAYTLARACLNTELQALTAAWLAHFTWNQEDVVGATTYASEALAKSSASDHHTRVRVSLVLTEILAISGREDLALIWAKRAQRHAAAVNDWLSKSTLAFNLATIKLMVLRQNVLNGVVSEERAEYADRLRQARHNVETVFGARDGTSRLQDAQLLSLRGRAEPALSIYLRLAKSASGPSAVRERSVWLADEAWCFSRLGRHAEALRSAAEATTAIDASTQLDDLASIHSMLSSVYRAAGNLERADHFLQLAQTQWAEYRRYQQTCISLCEGITENG